ncbi:MAG: hypothetical protein KZQ75_02085 [Candidatus Thiodiazotropha sp. (ex Myrtea spinifera)]|nr:hypothetical protein [Candidatus Thiodiazotropha sp. (ex Myrtea spinifera)]
MSPELYELIKTVISALAGACIALAAAAKFGQSWFFKKLDAKYALDLAEKNTQLMGDLERKMNDLNKELQIEITHFKSQLEVLGGQQSKFLERKVTSILTLNQKHYLAVKNIKSSTDVAHMWVEEAMQYFYYQLEDQVEALSDYDVYKSMKEDRWSSFEKKAKSAFDEYSECLALNMPILPSDLVQEEMSTIDTLRKSIENSSMTFNRTMDLTVYIMNPEESETTVDECMNDLREETKNALGCKNTLDELSNALFTKARKSGDLIESLLKHNR